MLILDWLKRAKISVNHLITVKRMYQLSNIVKYSMANILRAFKGLLCNIEHRNIEGIEIVFGTKSRIEPKAFRENG